MLIIPLFFFFNDTATTEIYTLSLHDALPIFLSSPKLTSLVHDRHLRLNSPDPERLQLIPSLAWFGISLDRKSTRLNSSHANISYAVFCLKKKKKNTNIFINNIKSH